MMRPFPGPDGTVSPCGPCRQVPAESLDRFATIVSPFTPQLAYATLSGLLPYAFGPLGLSSS
jgi:cytidine deaminase